MSSSANAEVFYGYDLGQMSGPENDDFECEDLRPQWWKASEDYWGWDDVLKAKGSSDMGVEMDSYGYHQYEVSGYVLRIKESVQDARPTQPTAIKPLDVDPSWTDQLARAVELLEMPPLGEPGWHLVVSYG